MKNVLTAFISLFLLSCAPSTQSPPVSTEEALVEIRLQKEIAVRERMEQLKRLYRVGLPIQAANAPLCGNKVWPHHGMMLESLSSVPEKFKDAMSIFYGLQNQLTAAYITQGSPADGKIQSGDLIVKANGVSIPSGTRGKKVFLETIWKDGRDVTLPITLTIERGRKRARQDVVIHPVAGCASMPGLEEDDEVNAYADGLNVIFSSGMMRDARDDNMLAAVYGHELAHNARLHNEARTVNVLLSQLGSIIIAAGTSMDFSDVLGDLAGNAFSQDFETEADYVGLYMMARAGYDPVQGMNFARRLGALNPDAIHILGTTHPSTAKRFISMQKTAAEITKKKDRGEPLLPNER